MQESPPGSGAGPRRTVEPERALGYTFEPPPSQWSEREVALYALATGAADDPTDDRQLRRVYERHSAGMEALPGFFGVIALNALIAALREGKQAPGLSYGIDRVLHAEQVMEFVRPLGVRGALEHRSRIAAIHDKGRHAIVVNEVRSFDERGELCLRSEVSSLIRGAGGFGGPRGEERPDPVPADRPCDMLVEQRTHENQALLFRLLGDDNPLHADPVAARPFGLRKPIIHGMCTLGHAMRHVVDALGEDPANLRQLSARFSDVVFPGETLVTEVWRLGPDRAAFRVRVTERDRVAISHGEVRFGPPPAAANPRGAGGASSSTPQEIRSVLDAISAHLAVRPALARSIGAAFGFRLRSPDVSFVIDLREAPGVVREGEIADADCSLELSAADFFALQRGDVLGRSLYLTGALKMTGRTGLASHLDFLREVGRAPVSVGAASAANGAAPSDAIAKLGHRVRERGRTTTAVRLGVRLRGEGEWTVDLGERPEVRPLSAEAKGSPPVAVLGCDRAALEDLVERRSTMRALYMHGRLRIDGDMSSARALERILEENSGD